MSEQNENKLNLFRPKDNLDAALQRELDEALDGMSLDQIIDAEEAAEKGARGTGQGVRKGRVVAIQGDDIFVDLGGRSEGVLPAAQFAEEPLPEVGQIVEVTIEGYDQADGLLVLSRQGAVMAAAWETIEEGQVVEGRVTGENKGGLELDIQGIRAFMPISQIEMFRVEGLKDYLNQRLRCQVTEVDRAEKNVIVSRRALLEVEAEEKREEMFNSLIEGQTVMGVVRSIMPYGAFVDIGGADGLLHVRDMSHARVEDPKEIVKEGQKIEVMILKIDREARKIGLGLKQVMPDPWTGAETKWPVDEVVAGRVTRLADFGAFLELTPGVEGLIPISEMSFAKRIKHPSEVCNVGDVVKVRVMNVDTEKKRISLSIKRVGDDPWMGALVRWAEGAVTTGVVTRIADFGAFVELAPGVEGMVHVSEISTERVRSVGDALQVGQTVKVKVLAVDETARRIGLSIKQADDVVDYASYMNTADRQAASQPAAEGPRAKKPKKQKPRKGGLD